MALVLKQSDVILNEVLATHDDVKKCPKCKEAFGALKADGTVRKVMSACAFQKGANVAEARRKSCVICDECVFTDEDGAHDPQGTGHVLDKSGKCLVCVDFKGIEKRYACMATLPATEVEPMTKMFASLASAELDREYMLAQEDAERSAAAEQEQRIAAAAAKDARAQRRGFKDRADEIAQREKRMAKARSLSENAFTGTDWDDFVEWEKGRIAAEQADKAAKAAEKAAADAEAKAAREKRAAEVAFQQERDKARQALEAAKAAAAAPQVQSKVRTQEVKDAAKQKRQRSTDTLTSTHTAVTNIAQLLGVRAPKGMVIAAKGKTEADLGTYRLQGKATKETLFEHMPTFLDKAFTKMEQVDINYEKQRRRANRLVKALHSVLEANMRSAMGDDATDEDLDAAIEAKITQLGVFDDMTIIRSDVDGEEEEEEGEEEEEEEPPLKRACVAEEDGELVD